MQTQDSIEVAILGATGLVGQKTFELLNPIPNFHVTQLAASPNNQGKQLHGIPLQSWEDITTPYVISCLPAPIATEAELTLASRGQHVFSNASAHRMHETIPLLVPEVNANELAHLEAQSTPGHIITNPNCVAGPLSLAVAPLCTLAPINHLNVVTLQAISGAGYAGIERFKSLTNAIPHIPNESSKIIAETQKILSSHITPEYYSLAVQVNRIPTPNGHQINLTVYFEHSVSIEEVKKAYQTWNATHPHLFQLHTTPDAPQASQHLAINDMTIHLGTIQHLGAPNIIGMTVLSDNLVRGAAGAAIANLQTYLTHTLSPA